MIIKPVKSLKGIIQVPGDKSISHRSIMFGALSEGTTRVTGFLMGADCLSTIACFRQLGVEIEVTDDLVTIEGVGLHGLKAPSETLDVGNSGTTMRIMSGILSGQPFETRLIGDASIQSRPMSRIIKPLSEMGADIVSENNDGKAPLVIKPSKLHGITYKSPVASAQVKSSIIMANLFSGEKSTIIEPAPSRNHTELMMNAFGGKVVTEGCTIVSRPTDKLVAVDIDVPGDISSAAFFLVAGLILPDTEITLTKVGINPTRDGILHVLKSMGGNIRLSNQKTVNGELIADITVSTSKLHGTVVEGDIIPTLIDEIPAIAVAASYADGQTIIKDAAELKVKETNRIDAMVTELSKMSADITPTDDGMIIKGVDKLKGAVIDTYHDHRIAMSLAVAGLAADSETKINDADIINVSYPGFFEDIKRLTK